MLPLQIYLFGSPRIELNKQAISISRRKPMALLAYLATTQQPHTRDALAALFWPEHDQSSARANLRRTLHSLRKAIGHERLEVTRQQIGLKFEEDCWVDVVHFQNLLQAAKSHHAVAGELCDDCAAKQLAAAEIYTAPFMNGFTLLDAPLFDEWQFFEAAGLRQSLANLLQQIILWHTRHHAYSEAIEQSRRWLALDPLHEPAQRQLMQLFAQAGQQAAAWRQYQECVRLLDNELGVEPEPETTALAEAIRTRQVETQHKSVKQEKREPPSPPPRNLPIATTSFIGREQELAQLAGLLADPEQRLVTIVGPGGMGKTRLALAAATLVLNAKETAVHDLFPAGAHFVPLAPLTSAEPILLTIADSLHFRFTGTGTPKEQLLDYLRHQQMLLIMDNFEHVLAGAGLIADILQAAPHVQILATSRERLNLLGETVLLLGGLDVPEPAMAVADDLPAAVQLWQQHAQLSQPNYTLRTDELQHIIQICQLVQGMPLALILAAGWADMLPPAEIVAEIKQNLGFLETPLRDVPERQQSMRMVFDASWERLTTVEQASFRQLSVFHGGFTRVAAQTVAGATLSILRRLAHQSFVMVGKDGRYQIHELLRQYAAEKLLENGAEATHTHAAHSGHYLNVLHQLNTGLRGGRQLTALNAIEIEIENIRSAWAFALEHQNETAVNNSIDSLLIFFHLRGRLQEGIQFFELARQQSPSTPGTGISPLNGRIESHLAFMQLHVSGFDNVKEATIIQCLDSAQKAGDQAEEAFVLDMLATILCVFHGDAEKSLEYFQQSLTIYRAINDNFYYARGLISIIQLKLVDFTTAKQYTAEALALSQAIGDEIGTTYALAILSQQAIVSGDYATAETHCHAVYQLSTKMDLSVVHSHTAMMLGLILFLNGNFEEGEKIVDTAVIEARTYHYSTTLPRLLAMKSLLKAVNGNAELAIELGQEGLQNLQYNQLSSILACWALAMAHTSLQEYALAWKYVQQVIEQADKEETTAVFTWVLPVTAVLCANEGQTERAVGHLALAHTHPQSPSSWSKKWPLLIESQKKWQRDLGTAQYQTAWENGTNADLTATIHQHLQDNN